eukprot:scaffold648578_cov34-Prasinocladus_malaysianus.AAC.1
MVEDNAQLREQKRQAERRLRESLSSGSSVSVGLGSTVRTSGQQAPRSQHGPTGGGGVSHPED